MWYNELIFLIKLSGPSLKMSCMSLHEFINIRELHVLPVCRCLMLHKNYYSQSLRGVSLESQEVSQGNPLHYFVLFLKGYKGKP